MEETLKISEAVKSGRPTTSQDVYSSFQRGFEKLYGVTIRQMLDDNLLMIVSNDIKERPNFASMKNDVQFVKQTDMATSTGSMPILNNPVTGQIGQFGGATGVFNPAQYAMIMEGVAYKTIIPKLWGIQPPASPNDLIAQLVYLVKTAPTSGNTPVYARTAEGRAGSDVGFELASVNVDWGRRIVHTPVTYELERVLAGRLPLQKTISDIFAELYAVAQDGNAFDQWYQALDSGTLEGDSLALYTDGAIADVDGMPAGYKCFYDLSSGQIKAGDNSAIGSATQVVASGADLADLASYICQWMSSINTGYRTSARLLYTPDYLVLPPAAVYTFARQLKDKAVYYRWVDKSTMDSSALFRDENLYCGRLSVGAKSLDIWSTPDWLNLSKATTDSPTQTIYPGFAGKYQMMGAISDLTGPILTTDKDFEVKSVGGVSVLRDRKATVHTMFSLQAERILNASMSFLIKFVA